MNIDLLERLGHLYVPEGLEAVAINFLPEGLPKLGELDALGTRRSDKLQHLDWAPLVVGNRPGWNAKGDASRTIVAEILDICGAAPDSVEARPSCNVRLQMKLEAEQPGFGAGHRFLLEHPLRSEESRVGNECGRTCRSRWAPGP